MGYEPNGRITYMHNQPRPGDGQIPIDVALNGDDEAVQAAWEEYARGVASYGISIAVVGTIFAVTVAIFSCVACAQACGFKGDFCKKPSLIPRMISIWAFAAMIGVAALLSIIAPTSVRNIGQAYVDGLDTGIDFLEISVRLGDEVESIGDGLDNMTTAANNINDELAGNPQAQDLRTAINDFIGAVSDSAADVKSSGGDIADSTKDARQSLVDLRDANVRGQISRGTNSNAILNFLFFVTFAVAGALPFLPTFMPIAHKFLTGITCCCCVLPTFWVAGVLGVIAMVGSDVCFDIEDTLVAIVELGQDEDDATPRALSVAALAGSQMEEEEYSTGDQSGFGSIAASFAAKGAWYAADASGLPVSQWLEAEAEDANSAAVRVLQVDDDDIAPAGNDDDVPGDTGVDTLKYYLKCHESNPPPLPSVLATARDGANTFYSTSNDLNRIVDQLEQYYTQIPELEGHVVTMRTGFLTINESVADTMDLFLCDGVNEPIYNFISIVCNDAVGNGIVLAFQLMAGTAFMAVIGMVPNLFILARHPAEEYKEPQVVSITVNMVGGVQPVDGAQPVDGVQPNPVNGYEAQAGGYPGATAGSINAPPESQPEFHDPVKAPSAPVAPPVTPHAGQLTVPSGQSPFLAQPPSAPEAPPAGFVKQEPF